MFLGQRDKHTEEDADAQTESSSTADVARPKSPAASRVHVAPVFQRSASESGPTAKAGLANLRNMAEQAPVKRMLGAPGAWRDVLACDLLAVVSTSCRQHADLPCILFHSQPTVH